MKQENQPHLKRSERQIVVFKWILTKRFWENVSCCEVMTVRPSMGSCVHHNGPYDSVPEVEYNGQ